MGVLGTAVAGSVAQSPTKWDLYIVTGVTHPITLRYKEFAEEVKKATNGKLEIVVRPAGELPFRATEVVKVAGEARCSSPRPTRDSFPVRCLSPR